ncbi:MAG: hypothetical protein LKG38_00835 [Atopobiaceae bacterium]|nr:hypothetical protein [Atopobiaceae bacterium]MCH4120069.1 hypothetical protein [Atopobiaceae bacterium]MCI1317873.1 hypothetical protein [Atopobiaceae bacterium]MCI1388414.1 hypothetical protein [Atopobiaceae bacterium]MCI1431335.1 hypothetical protein [Atopobiaceae bacterium]
MSFQKRWLPILLGGLFVVAMVWASVALSMPEVLFPETTAILCGAWIQPRQAWNVSRPRMLALMGAGAVFGLGANLLLPWMPLAARATLGYAFCALAMNVAGADMTPMLSAAILPMLLGTDSFVYPIVVVSLVVLVELGQVALERVGLREPIEYHPFRPPWRQVLRSWGRKLAVFMLTACPAYAASAPFLAVPPLLVAYTELTRPDFSLRLRPWRAWAALAIAAVIGCAGRDAVEILELPSPLVVAVAYACLVLAWDGLRTWLPPAGAVVLLAFLVPWQGPWLYAVEVAAGGAVWVAAAIALFPGLRPSMLANATGAARDAASHAGSDATLDAAVAQEAQGA